MPTTRAPQKHAGLARHWPLLAILLVVAHAMLHVFLQSHPGQRAIVVFLVAPRVLFAATILTIGAAAYDVLHGGWRRLLRGTAIFPIAALAASLLLALLTYRAYPSSYDGLTPGWCLALPLAGDIVVLQGGPTTDTNEHAASPSQRYAYDLGIARDGAIRRGQNDAANDYDSYDQIVMAPIAGQVVAVADGEPDRSPAALHWNPFGRGAGNHVVLEVDQGRYLFLSRLEAGSILVREGDHVSAGAPVARVGASGTPGPPHLQLHVQDHPQIGRGEAVPVEFCSYEVVDWGGSWETARRVARGMPTGRDHRQVIRAAAPLLEP